MLTLDRIQPGARALGLILLVSWIACSLSGELTHVDLFGWLDASSDGLRAGQLWRIFTYPLTGSVHFLDLLALLFQVWFASGVESTTGRRGLFRLLAAACLSAGVVLAAEAALGAAFQVGGWQLLTAAILSSYCALYPRGVVRIFLVLPVACSLLLGLSVVAVLAYPKALWLPLWAAFGVPYLMVTRGWGLSSRKAARTESKQARKRRKSRLDDTFNGPKITQLRTRQAAPPRSSREAEVDRIIDKLQNQGMAALTPEEKAVLDASSSRARVSGLSVGETFGNEQI